MAYKCCKCNNTLNPQGPIQGVSITKNGQITIKNFDEIGDIPENGRIRNKPQIQQVTDSLPSPLFLKLPLLGTLDDFLVSIKSVNDEPDETTIHCYNCNHTCIYYF